MKYSKWYLNLALQLRAKVRAWTFNRDLTQYGTISQPITAFFETLLDIRHQETFLHTIPNNYVQDCEDLKGYHVPKI